jgi:glycosyltransferase involved in cell wall biosynthesis
MKILQALFFPPEQPGGVSSMVPYIQEHFVQNGWDMDLFYLPKRIRNKGTDEIEFETFDWKPYAGNYTVDRYVQTLRDYLWWIKIRLRERYDMIHAHHPVAALAMKAIFPEVPVLMTIHSSYERELILNGRIEPGGNEEKFLTSLYGELEAKVDKLITVSHSFKSYLAQFIRHPERVEVIHNGFDQKRFHPIAHDNPVPQLITLCRLVPAKGLDVLMKACAELKRRKRPFVLHIIGDGPMREQLEQMAIELDIYDETIFYGYMLHPEEFIPFFDIFVLPSRAEAFGSVFAEAALSWVALVGTNVGGIAEQIEHEVNGLLVPVDDVDALADAVERLIVDPDLRYRLAKAAWEKATREYSLDRVIERLQQIYYSVMVKK